MPYKTVSVQKDQHCAYLLQTNGKKILIPVVDSYKLGSIDVEITETDHPNKLKVVCNDGTYRSEFTVRKYEYKNYKRHMNQRIKNAYDEQHNAEEE